MAYSEVYESYKEAAAAYVDAKAIYPAQEGSNVKRSVFFALIYFTDETKKLYQTVDKFLCPKLLLNDFIEQN